MVIFTVGGFLGAALGMLGIGLLGVADQWRHVFVIAGIPGMLLAPVVLAMVKEPRREAVQTGKGSSLTAIVDLLRIRSFRRMALGFASVMLVASAASGWISAFLSRTLGFDQNQIFLFVALSYGLGGALGALISGFLAARLRLGGADRPLLLCAAISAIFTIAYCTSFLFPLAVFTLPALVVALVIVGASQGPVLALVQDLVPSDRRGIATALLLFLINAIGLGLGPLMVGLFSDALHPKFGPDSVRYALVAVISVGGTISGAAFFCGSKSIKSDIAANGDPVDLVAQL
jgi:MFS family permease